MYNLLSDVSYIKGTSPVKTFGVPIGAPAHVGIVGKPSVAEVDKTEFPPPGTVILWNLLPT